MQFLQRISLSIFFILIFCFGKHVSLSAQNQLALTIETKTVEMTEEEMCVDVLAENFDLLGFQFTISWDSTILRYSRVTDANVPFFLQSTYVGFPDMFRIAWLNETITNTVTLPDNSPIFTLCFTPEQPGTTPMYFDTTSTTPLHPEFVGLASTSEATLTNGTVTVLGCTASTTTLSRTICGGTDFEGYTESGRYTDIFSMNGCDSTRILNLTVLPIIETTIDQSICEGETHEGRTEAGTYVDRFTSSVTGCDSVRTLLLSVTPSPQTILNRSVCAGSCFTLNGTDYCETGNYTANFTTPSGCDSLVLLNLSIEDVISGNEAVQICSGEVWIEGGMALDTPGVYNFLFTSTSGCDSVHTLELSFYEESTATFEAVSICEGEDFEGRTIAGNYTDTLPNSNGCDSIHTLTLTVNQPVVNEIARQICEGASFESYTETGRYIDDFVASTGCDSTRILNLTVTPSIETTSNVTICEGEAFEGFTASGEYQITATSINGCDSIHTINLTVLPNVEIVIEASICEGEAFEGFTATGTYTASLTGSNGCDSVRQVNLTVLPSDDINCSTTPTIEIAPVVIVNFYPNPVTTHLYLEWNGAFSAQYSIMDLSGKIVLNERPLEATNTVDASTFVPGVYYLKIDTDKGSYFSKLLKL